MKQALAFVLSLFISAAIWAEEERHIHLNGEHLEGEQILMMDALFGGAVADGFYWVNENTGEWGYEDSAEPQGVLQTIVDYNNQQQAEAQQTTYNGGNTEIDMSQNGRVVSGQVNGQHCTYVTVEGMTVRSCD